MTRQQIKTPRQVKTPAQRAQEALSVLSRRIGKLRTAKRHHEDQVADLTDQIAEVQTRLDYALQNPDLPTQPQSPA